MLPVLLSFADGRPLVATTRRSRAPSSPVAALSRGVATAVVALADGLLSHPGNLALQAQLAVAADPAADLHRVLLGVVYRWVVARAAEPFDPVAACVAPEPAGPTGAPVDAPPAEPWDMLTAHLASTGPLGALGIAAAPDRTAILRAARLDSSAVAAAHAALVADRPSHPVDAAALGALHEALLAHTPTLAAGRLTLATTGRARKASGSFYTPAPLVDWLLDAALEPILDEAVAGRDPADAIAALLALRVCDPACGAGAFLVGAGRRITRRLDTFGDGAPAREPAVTIDPRVAARCLHGVDLDPLAVLLCRAGLWLAAGAAGGTGLTDALAAHVRHGDALLGIDPTMLAAGLPDAAFAPLPGDDRAIANAWRRQNARERDGASNGEKTSRRRSAAADPSSSAPPAPSPADLLAAADAWCAAFLWPRAADAPPPPTTALLRELLAGRALPASTAALSGRIAREAVFCHWPLAFPDVPGFDVVLGNPPFLNQLERGTVATRPIAALHRAVFAGRVGAYTDHASLLLLRGARLLRAGGRLGMVQPQSIVGAQDSRAIRTELAGRAPPTHAWWAGEHVFPGVSVLVTALALRDRGDEPPPAVAVLERAVGAGFTALAPLAYDPVALASAETWTPLVAEALGAPPLALHTRGTLGDLAAATADFRDEYYGLVPFVVERRDADEAAFARLVVTGHIDPARSWWGARPARFGRKTWTCPRVDRAALDRDGSLAAWARGRAVPKVLVATQTRVLEAVVDVAGHWLTTTPTLTILPHDGALWRVAAVLSSPPASAWALAHYGASALAAGALKLSARQIEGLPLPVDEIAWDEAAALVAAAHASVDPTEVRRLVVAAARASTRAYSAPEALFAWWEARLPPVGGSLPGVATVR
jgi:hypothetical protein